VPRSPRARIAPSSKRPDTRRNRKRAESQHGGRYPWSGVTVRALRPAAAAAVLAACGGAPAHAAARAYVRVDQVGFPTGATVAAHVLSRRALHAPAQLRDQAGTVVEQAPLGRDLGRWSARVRHVYAVRLPAPAPGVYTLAAAGASSPAFRVAPAAQLYAPLVGDELRYLRAQRDGADVDPAVMDRRPSHLSDAHARLYATPRFSGTRLASALRPAGGTVDVEGGWMDAGDTLKYAETASFTEVALLVALRDHPAALDGAAATAEARRGMDWLLKLWDPARRRLVYQVGLGDGGHGVLGAHDVWAPPDAEPPGARARFIRDRPAFAERGSISPNLAGRMAAAYALGAQVLGPGYEARCLAAARSIYAAARTRGRLVTAAPYAYYPEREWQIGRASCRERV